MSNNSTASTPGAKASLTRAGRPAPAPPATNRGALITSVFLVDWLEYTLPDGTLPGAAVPFLDAAGLDWTELDHGFYGYAKAKRWGQIMVMWEGREGMGVHVRLSGQGCREAEALGVTDWPAVYRQLLELGASFSRTDYALDDRDGLLDMGCIVDAVRRGAYTSPANRWTVTEGGHKKGDQDGVTVQIGARVSETVVRIYDKQAEQGLDDGATWIRVELELKGERAQLAAVAFSNPDGAGAMVIVGLVRRHLDFKDEDQGDSNVTRQTSASWWERFLDGASKVKLSTAPALRTIEQVRQWVHRQVAPSLSLLVEVAGGDLGVLMQAVIAGQARYGLRHRLILASAAAAGG